MSMPSLPLTPHEDVARFVYPEACTLSPPPRDALDVVGGEGIQRSGRTLRSPAVIILFTVDIFSTSSSPNLLCVGCENTRDLEQTKFYRHRFATKYLIKILFTWNKPFMSSQSAKDVERNVLCDLTVHPSFISILEGLYERRLS